MLVTFAIDEEARVVGGFINIYYRGPRNRTSSGRHIEIRVKRNQSNNGASLLPSFFLPSKDLFLFFLSFILFPFSPRPTRVPATSCNNFSTLSFSFKRNESFIPSLSRYGKTIYLRGGTVAKLGCGITRLTDRLAV